MQKVASAISEKLVTIANGILPIGLSLLIGRAKFEMYLKANQLTISKIDAGLYRE